MKSLRKIFVGVFLVGILVVSTIACDKEDNKTADVSKHSQTWMKESCSEDGIFYMANDQLLHFVSEENGEDIIFCFDPVCEHEPPSATNKEPECMAAGYYNAITKVSYHNKYVYLFVTAGISEHSVYKMDISSGVRELVAKLPFDYNIDYIVFDNGRVYYMARFKEFAEDGINTNLYYDLVEVNLEDGSHRMITTWGKEKGTHVNLFDVCGDTVFVNMAGNYEHYFYVIDLNTLEIKFELGDEECKKKCFSGVYDSESYYYMKEKEIGVCNVITGEDKVLLQLEDTNMSFYKVQGALKKLYFEVGTSYYEVEQYLYDEASDETYNITEKCKELNILRYDAYKGKFICNIYDETGEKIMGKLVVDEADVLGE